MPCLARGHAGGPEPAVPARARGAPRGAQRAHGAASQQLRSAGLIRAAPLERPPRAQQRVLQGPFLLPAFWLREDWKHPRDNVGAERLRRLQRDALQGQEVPALVCTALVLCLKPRLRFRVT